ncbi:hypothetical protein RLDS_02935 [Sphingobium lactosutens DS20]|uniref:Uncharacterized protein n=1 Tax=Sphingobium lactosutens DS20 TaxID=1331060 RepID=T0IL13_9SPHN|nr:hypothetical protein RLDS_20185 [Sphingobium lactosutens DS20]EQB18216.1 hypothetical protein RLDS_02935 [Sphingobium lactosutens DS20]
MCQSMIFQPRQVFFPVRAQRKSKITTVTAVPRFYYQAGFAQFSQ